MGMAWWTVIAVEMFVGGKGIGFLVFDAYQIGKTADIITGIICISILGFFLDRLIYFAGYRISQFLPAEEKNEQADVERW